MSHAPADPLAMALSRIDRAIAPRAAWFGIITGGVMVAAGLIGPAFWWLATRRIGAVGPGSSGEFRIALMALVQPPIWIGLFVLIYHWRGRRPNLEREVPAGRLDRFARFQLLGRISAAERRTIWQEAGRQRVFGPCTLRHVGLLSFVLVPLVVLGGSRLMSHLVPDLRNAMMMMMLAVMIAAAIPIFARMHAAATAALIRRHPTACRRCAYEAGHEARACPECGHPMHAVESAAAIASAAPGP